MMYPDIVKVGGVVGTCMYLMLEHEFFFSVISKPVPNTIA